MTERNEPCPCGSGKKFKKCCMKDRTKGGTWIPGNVKYTAPRQPPFVLEAQRSKLERLAQRGW